MYIYVYACVVTHYITLPHNPNRTPPPTKTKQGLLQKYEGAAAGEGSSLDAAKAAAATGASTGEGIKKTN